LRSLGGSNTRAAVFPSAPAKTGSASDFRSRRAGRREGDALDPRRQIVVVVLMQLLPYYDEAPLKIVRGFEHLVYQQLR